MDAAARENLVYPGKLLYLEIHTFRNKGPAIVGMRVLGGRVHLGQRLMKLDGTPVGQIKSLRSRASEELKEAKRTGPARRKPKKKAEKIDNATD